jgi:hypothetical protein
MNEYYYEFILQKLKQDSRDALLAEDNGDNTDIILKEIDIYFTTNNITFTEVNISSGTHQVRNRNAYQDKVDKCKALVWNEGYGGQCSRSGKDDCNGFCKTHFHKGGCDWWLGTIEQMVERPVDSNGKIHYWIRERKLEKLEN